MTREELKEYKKNVQIGNVVAYTVPYGEESHGVILAVVGDSGIRVSVPWSNVGTLVLWKHLMKFYDRINYPEYYL